MLTTPRDPWTGLPSGMPEWPYPGGMLRQPARLVDAVQILQATLPEVLAARKKPEPEPEAPPSSGQAHRRARKAAR